MLDLQIIRLCQLSVEELTQNKSEERTRLLAVAIGLVTQNQSQYHGRGKGTIIIRLVSNRWRADGHYSLLTMVSSMVKAK